VGGQANSKTKIVITILGLIHEATVAWNQFTRSLDLFHEGTYHDTMVRPFFHALSGWGHFPVQECVHYRPEKRRQVAELLRCGPETSYLARGLGRSYGDNALNEGEGLLETTRLNRLLSFDAETGVLHCEAGVSLQDLLEVFLPRGFFVPVTPGTRFVTVGGAIANDVHGKNHHVDGSFGDFVEELTLLTASGEIRICSPELHPEVFWATVGGIGLTGVILTARIRLKPVETAWVRVDTHPLKDLEETLARMEATDQEYRYSVTWIDCLAQGKHLGRSVLMQGNPALRGDLPTSISNPLALPRGLRVAVPFNLPGRVVNRFTVGLMNGTYYRLNRARSYQLVPFGSYFYPLDAVAHWNRAYGKGGFLQYQVSFPEETAEEGLRDILEALSKRGAASFLAVLKRFGSAGMGMLSYPFSGFTLALDIPYRPGLVAFLQGLEEGVLARRGRFYLAKDSCLTPRGFRSMYPRHREFLDVVRELDPEGRLSSSQARRLEILHD
jgi:FAD/FMN-containing dehydrogenase